MTLHERPVLQVKVLLGKVQAVFDLPRRLHAAIDHGALEIAVATYADAEPLLRRYGHKVRKRPRPGSGSAACCGVQLQAEVPDTDWDRVQGE